MSTSPRSYEIRRGSDVGAAIAEARRSIGLTQDELATQLGIQRSYLAAMEGGRTGRLLEHLLRALRRLGAEVTVTWSPPTQTDDDRG